MAPYQQPLDDLEVNVPQVLERLRLDGQVIQDEFVGLCVFHQEEGSPNLEINTKTGLWHCWVCGEKGNLPKLVMRLLSVTYKEALEIISDYSSMVDIATMRTRNLAALKVIQNTGKHVFDEVDIEPYQTRRSWWWTNSIPYGRFTRKTATRYSLGFDGNHQRAVIPVSFEGAWVGIIRRAVRNTQRPRYLYSDGFDRRYVLFGLDTVPRQADGCVVVEGAKDCFRLREYGIQTSVASLGTGLTEEQLQLIEDNFDEVTVFSDNDPAGHIAALKMCADLAERIPRVFVVQWRVARKDPNELTEEMARKMLARRVHWTALIEPDYNPYGDNSSNRIHTSSYMDAGRRS